jgi:hypothetical protein
LAEALASAPFLRRAVRGELLDDAVEVLAPWSR